MMRVLLVLGAAALLAGCAATRGKIGAIARGEEPVATVALEGRWLITDVNGADTALVAGGADAPPAPDIVFDGGDQGASRVSGTTGCNRFAGAWVQNRSAVTLGPLAMTKMACPPPVMQLEAKLLAVLAAVRTVAPERGGGARLTAPDGRALVLRRPAPAPR